MTMHVWPSLRPHATRARGVVLMLGVPKQVFQAGRWQDPGVLPRTELWAASCPCLQCTAMFAFVYSLFGSDSLRYTLHHYTQCVHRVKFTPVSVPFHTFLIKLTIMLPLLWSRDRRVFTTLQRPLVPTVVSPGVILSLCSFAFSSRSYKWNPTVCSLLNVASLT